MISFDAVRVSLGLTNPFRPAPLYTYFAYKNGESFQFASKTTAEQFSSNIEAVITNTKEIDDFWKNRNELEAKAFDIWYTSLRNEFSDLSDSLFELCYNQAYATGHSYGHDEIANKMIDIVDFALTIKNLVE